MWVIGKVELTDYHPFIINLVERFLRFLGMPSISHSLAFYATTLLLNAGAIFSVAARGYDSNTEKSIIRCHGGWNDY